MENPYASESNIDPQNDFRREIPTPTFNALAAARLSGAEYQVIFVIIDRSWGWSKPFANISLKHFENATNLSRHSVINAVKSLEQKRIIVIDRYKVEGGKKVVVNKYLFNKYYDTWLCSGLNGTTSGSEEIDTTSEKEGSEEIDTTQQQSSEEDGTTQLQSSEEIDTTLGGNGGPGSEANDTRVVNEMTLPSEVNDTTSSADPKAGPGYAKETLKESTFKESTSKESTSPETVEEPPSPPPKTPNTPYNEILKLYHELCPSLPRVRELSEKRKNAIRSICKREDDSLSYFRELFSKAEASDFLSGRKISDKHGNWRCGLDWLLEERNRLKVLEGNYDNKGGQNGRGEPGEEGGSPWPGFRAITD